MQPLLGQSGYHPLLLTILDGFGWREEKEGNAVRLAKTPTLDQLFSSCPWTLIQASGEAVGLPAGQMGNSEVGHLNIGAGRIVYQELTRINLAIRDASFFRNPVLNEAFLRAKEGKHSVHFLGLVSDGGVHSHLEHLYALLQMAKNLDLERVFVHAFLDGRDTPPKSALTYLEKLERKFNQIGVGKVATVSGRYYAMDRDKRWERTKLAYDCLVLARGERAKSSLEAVERAYSRGETDEFVRPTVVIPEGTITSGDSVIFFNFRPDRARQLSRALNEKDFTDFEREKIVEIFYVTFTRYDETFPYPVAFPPQSLENILADVLAANEVRQLRIAETEKYAHVTYFFNGGDEKPRSYEDRILIPSPKVPTYDLKPEMSAYEVTQRLLKELEKKIYQVIILNFANLDMVGHTGKLEAAIKAVEAIDECLGILIDKIQEFQGACLITGDHGNAEEEISSDGSPHTAHTSNLVPFIAVIPCNVSCRLRDGGILADIAPTMLEILGLPKPSEMTGSSLIL